MSILVAKRKIIKKQERRIVDSFFMVKKGVQIFRNIRRATIKKNKRKAKNNQIVYTK